MARLMDRIKAPWAALVRHLLPATIDLFARYPAKATDQSGDWTTVSVTPDNPKIPGMTRVRLKLPPGYTAQVAAGARVLVGWEEGDPQRPYAGPDWDALDAIHIKINATGAKDAARKADAIKVKLAVVPGSQGNISGVSYWNGVGWVAIALVAAGGTDVTGEITGGSATVQIGD